MSVKRVCGATATLKFAPNQFDGVVCILDPGHLDEPGAKPGHEGWLNGDLVRFRAELLGPRGGTVIREGNSADVDRLQAEGRETPKWEPTRWWRAVGPDGELWCESSDKDEVRRMARDGDRIERLMQNVQTKWFAVGGVVKGGGRTDDRVPFQFSGCQGTGYEVRTVWVHECPTRQITMTLRRGEPCGPCGMVER